MQIRCPRCRKTFEPQPGETPHCPSCGDAAAAETMPDVAGPAASPAPGRPPGGAPPVPAADPLLGRAIGGYRILTRLGRGGMSTVYKAEQVSLTRAVALKIPHEDLVRDDRFRARFEL